VTVASTLARLRSLGALEFAQRLAQRNGLPLGVVLSKTRVGRVPRVRHELWSVVLDTFGLSYPEAGVIFGVSHSTILDGKTMYEWRRDGQRGLSPAKEAFSRRKT
jgi:hypothetical protein